MSLINHIVIHFGYCIHSYKMKYVIIILTKVCLTSLLNSFMTLYIKMKKNYLKSQSILGPYNCVCIAASPQPNFYLLQRHAAPHYFCYFWIAVVLFRGYPKHFLQPGFKTTAIQKQQK